MIQLILSFVIAMAVSFFLSKFVVPICLKSFPVPVQNLTMVNLIFTATIFGFSFGSSYFLYANLNKYINPAGKQQKIVPTNLSELTKKDVYTSDGKREAARVLALEALRQGTVLSVTISKLPKLDNVYQAAQRLLDISPRYQEQVDAAERELRNIGGKRDTSLRDYLNKVLELGRYKPEYASFALDSIRNGDLTLRERMVADLLNTHVQSLLNGRQADPAHWLMEFTQQFNNFVD